MFDQLVIRAPDEPDVIDEIYEAAKAGVPKEKILEHLGGRRVYIPANPRQRKAQQEAILRELQQRVAPATVARKHGVSVRQVYRLRARLSSL